MEQHKKRIRWAFALICTGIIFGGYSLYSARTLLIKPGIIVTTPRRGEEAFSSKVIISGNARGIVDLSLFGKDILVSEEGYFEESLLLAEGYNIIELHGKDRFGREAYTQVELVLHSR